MRRGILVSLVLMISLIFPISPASADWIQYQSSGVDTYNRPELTVAFDITQVDFGVGELGYRRWFSYSSIFEYMQAGLPTIHHRDDDFYKSKGFDLYPMIDADNSEIITQTFLDFEINKEKYKNIGFEARKWTEIYFEKSMNGFFSQINKKSNNNLIERYWFKKIKMKMDFEYFKYSLLFSYYKLKLVPKSYF